jgi:hypothetical protein
MTMEFLIKRVDGGWLTLHQNQFDAVLRPSAGLWQSTENRGDYGIRAADCEISFSFEEPGIQAVFESSTWREDEAFATALEIAARAATATGHRTVVIRL